MLSHLILFGIGLFGVWTGLGCLIGIFRFRYRPLLILALGYLLWAVAAFGLSTLVFPPALVRPSVWLGALVLGTIAIFGYRFIYYAKMRARGIHPKNLFGFGAS